MAKYRGAGALCQCGEWDTQAHLMACQQFAHLRVGEVDEQDDTDLITYLRELIHLREKEKKSKLNDVGMFWPIRLHSTTSWWSSTVGGYYHYWCY